MPHKLFFQKFEKGRAYFKDEENKTIILPEKYTKKIKEGDILYLNLSKNDNAAKDILNELLDIEK